MAGDPARPASLQRPHIRTVVCLLYDRHVDFLRPQDTPNGKLPWYFAVRGGSPVLTIAGIWDQWKNRETGELLSHAP